MEDNQDKKQDGGKGILIIIAIIVLAVAAYFIVQGVNKKNKGGNQPTVSISEADKLDLISSNLLGKWNKTSGKDRYELCFRSNNELVLTQYNSNGEVAAKSDEGAYSIDGDVLHLSIVSNGIATTASCKAELSAEKAVITAIEGSDLFSGVYDKNLSDLPDFLTSGDNSDKSGETSDETSVLESENAFDYTRLSPRIEGLIESTVEDLIAESSTPLERWDFVGAPGGGKLTIDGYTVGFMLESGYIDNGKIESFGSEPELWFMTVPAEMFFAHDNVPSKESYSYGELQEIYGNNLNENYGVDGYIINAVIDGYTVQFNADRDAELPNLETPITNCRIFATRIASGQPAESRGQLAEFRLPDIVDDLYCATGSECFGDNAPVGGRIEGDYKVYPCTYGDYIFDIYFRMPFGEGGEIYTYKLRFNIADVVPGLDTYNYYTLKAVLGDDIEYTERYSSDNPSVKRYYVTSYTLGRVPYNVDFGGPYQSLDSEIQYCFVTYGI